MAEDDAQSPGDIQTGRVDAARDRLEDRAESAVEDLDERSVELLSWLLDTETKARIYVHLRRNEWSTSQEVADGTGLYPSTVREALADLTAEDVLRRRKRESSGAGNNPFEYEAIAPSQLVADLVGQLQEELNTLCHLGSDCADPADQEDPVRIEVDEDENPNA
jgi:predicted transcriptional regulator